MSDEIPAPRFRQFERVLVTQSGPHHGEAGTVIWLDSSYVRRDPRQPDKWVYIVFLSRRRFWKSFSQADLDSRGGIDSAADHLGDRPEISFDLVLEEDNAWMEGCYRLPGRFWQVAIFQKADVLAIEFEPHVWRKPTKWEREITGVVFRLPRAAKVDREYLLGAMAHAFGYTEWLQVQGPDSIVLR